MIGGVNKGIVKKSNPLGGVRRNNRPQPKK
jgi:hypothetical protein